MVHTAFNLLLVTLPLCTVSQSIVDIAAATDELSTLVSLVGLANLVPALDGSSADDITVFAPTNEAFAALPSDLVDNLQTPPYLQHLTRVLTTHVVGSVLPSSAITMDTEIVMLSGERVDVTANPITIDGAGVVTADITADNGVVHMIDQVITPLWVDQDLPTAVIATPGTETLVNLLGMADLVETLRTEGPFTVFAPTEAAFAAVDDVTLQCLTANIDTLLRPVLLYHVIGGAMVPSTSLEDDDVTTAEGSDVTIDTATLTVQGANIVGADVILANNGIVHQIDSVLVPESISEELAACVEQASKSVVDLAVETDALSTLVSLVTLAELVPALDGSSGTDVTVFAPVNDAFAALPADFVAALQTPAWRAHLTSILTSHVLGSVVLSTDITEDVMVETLSKEKVAVTAVPITVDGATVVTPDLKAINGVVHVIDAVITPEWVEQSLPAVVSGSAKTKTLTDLLVAADLVSALDATGPFTVFAPTEEAFAALGPFTTKCLTDNVEEYLKPALLYHVVGAMVPASSLETASVPTLEGSAVSIDAAVPSVQGVAISGPDVLLANNGIVHSIDSVLVPASIADGLGACASAAKEAAATEAPTMAPVMATTVDEEESGATGFGIGTAIAAAATILASIV